jgi:hydrogenase-4 component E
MTIRFAIDNVLVLVLLLDLAMLAAGRLATCIRIFAVQCVALAMLPVAADLLHGEGPGVHALILAAGTVGLKVVLIPWILMRTIRMGEIQRGIEPFIGFTASVMVGAVMVVGSFYVGSRLKLPGESISDLLVPVSLSTLLVGMLILISRSKAITQVVGYLVLENGIFIFGLSLTRQMPILVELGILLDVFVGVFVMAIVVYHIRREFDQTDTHALTASEGN